MRKVYLNTILSMLIFVLSSCISGTQPASQEQQLRATIGALETQAALGKQVQATPTVPSNLPSNQGQQLQATIVALQTKVARSSVSPTAIPSPTPLLNTQPGTVLEVGQTWRADGAEVTLKEASLNTYGATGVLFQVFFTNRKPQDLSFIHSVDNNFSAVDNLGRRLKLGYFSSPYYETCSGTMVVRTGETVNLSCAGYFLAEEQIGDSAVTEVVITVSGISSIDNARWRIPIYH